MFVYTNICSNMREEENIIPPNLISASMDQTLRFWDYKHPPIKGKYSGFGRIIKVGKYIIATSTCIEVFNDFPPYERKMALAGHGKKKRIQALCKFQLEDLNVPMIATGGEGGIVKIWDLNVGRDIFNSTQGQSIVRCLLQHSTDYLISGGTSEAIIWKLAAIEKSNKIIFEILKRIPHRENNEIYGLIKIDEQIMLSYCYNTNILLKFWFVYEDSSKDILSNIEGLKGFTSGLKVEKRKELYLGGDNGHIYIFNWATITFIGDYHIHDDAINQVCMLSESQLITCSSDHGITICDIDNLQIKNILPSLHTQSVTDILLLADIQNEKKGKEIKLTENKEAKDLVEKDGVVLIIGGYKLFIKKNKLLDIAPIFNCHFCEELTYIVELPYNNADISFNHILQPYLIQGELPAMTDKILPECIILIDYFPLIKEKYDEYLSLYSQIVDNLFTQNRISQLMLDSLDSSPTECIH